MWWMRALSRRESSIPSRALTSCRLCPSPEHRLANAAAEQVGADLGHAVLSAVGLHSFGFHAS